MSEVPLFPGAVGITGLDVYDWDDDHGLNGGTPHVHLACAECYVAVAGSGRLQALTPAGFREIPLHPGDVVWFEPGTVHRSIDDGGLRVVVVMQNSGLPEAGDAVMTFPAEDLASPEIYRAAASLGDHPDEARARARRDRALPGFDALRASVEQGDGSALREFYARAAAIVRPRLGSWEREVREGPLAEAETALARIAALERGDIAHLEGARAARIEAPAHRGYGMCGFLSAYDPLRARGDAELS